MSGQVPDMIIIKGAPGSGKSETGKLLASHFPKGVRLEVDTLRSMVISVDWTNQKEHIELLEISAKTTIEFLNKGYAPVILIDTFSGDKLKRFLNTINGLKTGLDIKVFGLTVSESELKNRLEQRKEGLFKDFEACKKLNSDLVKFKIEQETHIDTTSRTVTETTTRVMSFLS